MARVEIVRRRAEHRRRAAPPLLFVHGAYAGAWCWEEHLLPHFSARGFDCLALSLRGHGRSAGAGALDGFGVDDYVTDVGTAAVTLAAPPLVIGHSMGGVVAQRYVADRAAAGLIVLAGVPPHGLMAESMGLCWRDPHLLAQFGLVQSGLGHFADHSRLRTALFARDMPAQRARAYFARMQRESHRALIELSSVQTIGAGLAAKLPVAVVGGEEDGLFRPESVHATARWLGTKAAVLPGLGHTMMLDLAWRRAADHIERWIELEILPRTRRAREPRRAATPE